METIYITTPEIDAEVAALRGQGFAAVHDLSNARSARNSAVEYLCKIGEWEAVRREVDMSVGYGATVYGPPNP